MSKSLCIKVAPLMDVQPSDLGKIDSQIKSLNLPGMPRAYQMEGIRFLSERSSAMLADGMGLGKTIQTILALRVLFSQKKIRRALIIAPSSLVSNWLNELQLWANNLYCRKAGHNQRDRLINYRLPIPIILASYEQIRIDAMANRINTRFDVVILDEAQRIKNRNSTTSLACKIVQRNMSWALTGTPLENRPSDLVSIFGFVNSNLIQEHHSRTEIHRRIAPFYLRRNKSEVLTELPPLQIQDLVLDLTFQQREAYETIWSMREDSLQGDEDNNANLLAIITKLKQICNYDPVTGSSVKLEALKLILEGVRDSDEKILVFSQYTETLNWVSEQIRGFPHDLYHGGMESHSKDEVIRKFQSNSGSRCLLMSLKAGGVGLNLQAATVVVMFDRWWNPAIEDQALARAHRMGQKLPVHAIRFKIKDTIEDRICEILQRKKLLFEDYVENARSGPILGFDRNQLLHILQLSKIPSEVSSS